MESAPISKEEKAWLRKLERLLMSPPTGRLGFYTIGDFGLTAYDRTRDDEMNAAQDARDVDFCQVVDELGARIGEVRSACQIHSTAG